MNRKTIKKYKLIELAILVWALAVVLALSVLSDTKAGTYSYFKLTVSSAGNVEIETAENGWTVRAYGTDGSCGATDTETVTFTITNTDTTRGVSFDIKVTSADASPSDAPNGSQKLAEGGALDNFTATSGDGSGNHTTITISITNIVQDSLDVDVETTFEPRTGGTIKVDGTAITSQTKLTKKDSESYTLTATADAEYTFFGWMSSEGVLTTDGALSYAYSGKNAATLWPLFIRSDSAMYFIKGASPLMYYGYLDEAITAAGTSEKVVVVYKSGTAYHSKDGSEFDITIPKNVTLLIPYDDNYTLCTTAPTVDGTTERWSAVANARKDPVVYRKLTMASGASITVNGAISISGMQCFAQRYNGMPTKATGVIAMEADSSITVNNGGFLYAWGYITGSGEISVMSGGTVYEDFQVKDWRGGSAASSMLNKSQRVFPVSQYYVQNVEVKMTLYAGAIEKAYMSIVASKVFGATTVPFIGSDGMFRLTNGYLVKDYLEDTDRLSVEIHGDLSMSELILSVSSYNMDSSKYVLPITNNLRINVAEGTTTISQDVALLPGSELVIDEGATVKLASGVKAFIYDLAEWEKKLFVYSSCDVSPLDYVGATGGKPNARPTMDDAKIEVNGTLDASLGYLYTTAGGANICSEGYGKVIIGTIDTSTVTYQATQSGTTITFREIPITPAKLKHANGDYLTTADATAATTYNYNVAHGYWYAGTHGETTATTPPTCTEKGYTNHSCPCGYKKQDEVPALGHNYGWKQEPVTNDNGTKNVDHLCCDRCDDLLAKVDLQYRLEDYIWMNAVVTLENGVTGEITPDSGIELVDLENGTYYLVRKVVAKELTTDFTAGLAIDGIAKPFTIQLGFAAFDATLPEGHKHKALVGKMVEYGKAAKAYFDYKALVDAGASTEGIAKPSKVLPLPTDLVDELNRKDKHVNTDVNFGHYLYTQGANIMFGERLAMVVNFKMVEATDGTKTAVDVATNFGNNLVKVGLLVYESTGDFEKDPVLSFSTEDVISYVIYGKYDATLDPSQPDFGGKEVNLVLGDRDLKNMSVSFDLTTEDYLGRFQFRPYVIYLDGNGQQQILYGRQFYYGLEDYIVRQYADSEELGQQLVNNLLVTTWDYAEAAAAAFPG